MQEQEGVERRPQTGGPVSTRHPRQTTACLLVFLTIPDPKISRVNASQREEEEKREKRERKTNRVVS